MVASERWRAGRAHIGAERTVATPELAPSPHVEIGVIVTSRAVVIVLHQLGFGGATKAVLDQAGMFSRAGREVVVATFDDNPTQSERVRTLISSGQLPEDVRVMNVHEEHCRRAEAAAERSKPATLVEKVVRRGRARLVDVPLAPERFVEEGEDSHGSYRRAFSAEGDLLDFTRLSAKGKVKHVNYYENAHRVRRDQYLHGAPHVRTIYDADGSPIRELFLARDGFCYAQRWIDPDTSKGRGLFVPDRASGTVQKHSGLPAWHVAWLQDLVDSFPVAPYVIAESSSAITKVMDLRADSAVRLAMMHNSHLTAPFEIDSPLRSDYDTVFRRVEQLDAYVVLSERQRGDMVERIGGEDVLTVVPNVLRFPDLPTVQKDDQLVSVVSRLAPQKSLHEAIHAFAMVHDELQAARLEIYGGGPSQQELESLVEELGLTETILFKGRTQEPLNVMARSICTLSTSEWEALPLSIAESLGVGTPVVAYDCLYGPSTLIKDGETGFVVPRKARKELAEAVLSLLRDPARARGMGAEGRADVKRTLDEDAVVATWQKSFDHADERFTARNSAH